MATKPSAGRAFPTAREPAGITDSMLPLQRAYRWERERSGAVFLTQPVRGRTRDWTWAQTMDEVRRMAAYLAAQNWPAGSRIVILSKNCAWWIMAELASWMAGHVTVPIYASLGAQSIRTLIEHCEPVCCFIGAVEDRRVATEAFPPGIPRIAFPTGNDPSAATWASIIAANEPYAASPVRAMDEVATVIYTSGTTGTPKGVLHRFASFGYFVRAQTRAVGEPTNDRFLSYLPLAHIAERALVEAIAIYSGQRIFFVESAETFLEDLRRARPTIFFSVPRLYIKFQQRILEKVPQHKLDRLLRIPVVRRLVQRRILRQLGLDCNYIATSGGAPLPMATLLWFRKLGLHLVEGYGMTETGITHTPRNGLSRPGYVGDAIECAEVKISESGEVLIKSPMNMLGYYKDPEATKAAFTEDGFFRTGDLGELDPEGWLKITGRMKEQFKTSKGKYISPGRIEKLILMHPGVEACCVVGAGMPNALAILQISQQVRASLSEPGARESLERSLLALREEVNRELDAHERLGAMVVVDEPWSIENGMLTPTMKLKRSLLEARYSASFDAWLEQRQFIVWHTRGSSAEV